jgi:hypothetical protein
LEKTVKIGPSKWPAKEQEQEFKDAFRVGFEEAAERLTALGREGLLMFFKNIPAPPDIEFEDET